MRPRTAVTSLILAIAALLVQAAQSPVMSADVTDAVSVVPALAREIGPAGAVLLVVLLLVLIDRRNNIARELKEKDTAIEAQQQAHAFRDRRDEQYMELIAGNAAANEKVAFALLAVKDAIAAEQQVHALRDRRDQQYMELIAGNAAANEKVASALMAVKDAVSRNERELEEQFLRIMRAVGALIAERAVHGAETSAPRSAM